MDFFRKAILVVIMMATLGSTMGAVYRVGDSAGWTFNFNYDEWVSSKNFRLGDELIFNYDPLLHNVRQVDKKDYDACTDHDAIGSFYTGNDSVILETPGEFYFLCGIPGHCASGLKFHINIIATVPVTTPTAATNNTPPEASLTPFFPYIPGFPARNPIPNTAHSSNCFPIITMLLPFLLATSTLKYRR